LFIAIVLVAILPASGLTDHEAIQKLALNAYALQTKINATNSTADLALALASSNSAYYSEGAQGTQTQGSRAPIKGCMDALQDDQGATSLQPVLQDHPEWTQYSRTPDSTVQTANLPSTWTSPFNGAVYTLDWWPDGRHCTTSDGTFLTYESRTGIFKIILNDPPCEPQREPHRSHRE
jgi:hypothetical protein